MVKVARGFFCPECGWNVGRDEDGLCLTCGVTTTDNPVVLAAPDMLGACEAAEKAMRAVPFDDAPGTTLRQLRAAITKARGGT